ncbi:MAG TPA: hypothetical protein VJ746_13130 [Nitrospira sp.]|nr:hypothetical protein [Nitrospira sp.]
MSRLATTRICFILAIWFLSGGLALADSFDLTDEFQQALPDRTQALEITLDEVRETVENGPAPVCYLSPTVGEPRIVPPISWFDIPSQAAKRPLHELLQTFRI